MRQTWPITNDGAAGDKQILQKTNVFDAAVAVQFDAFGLDRDNDFIAGAWIFAEASQIKLSNDWFFRQTAFERAIG